MNEDLEGTQGGQADDGRPITGGFVWYQGMLFFKPNHDKSLNGFVLALPNEAHPGLNVIKARILCVPANEVIPGIPNWLRDYETIIAILPEAVSIPLTGDFARQALKMLSPCPLANASDHRAIRLPQPSSQEGL